MAVQEVASMLNMDVCEEVLVDHMDYAYIGKCTNLRYLKQILKELRSGKNGLYPHLIEFCENRIQDLQPKRRTHPKEGLPATAADFPSDEWQKISEEQQAWEAEARLTETEVKNGGVCKVKEKVPPVRGNNCSVPLTQKDCKNSRSQKKSTVPRDYCDWDKFDVEKECSKIDNDENCSPSPIKRDRTKIKQELDVQGLTDKEKAFLAKREKDKGNEAFKANDYEEAVAYYTRSLSLMPTAAAYNNRALAEIKRQHWHKALGDCQKVLELEHNNPKALLRRATVHQQLDNLQEAANDLRNVLQTEPQNVTAKKMLEDLEKKMNTSSQQTVKRSKILIEKIESKQKMKMSDTEPLEKSKKILIEEIENEEKVQINITEPPKKGKKILIEEIVNEEKLKMSDTEPLDKNKKILIEEIVNEEKLKMSDTEPLDKNKKILIEEIVNEENVKISVTEPPKKGKKILTEEIGNDDMKRDPLAKPSPCAAATAAAVMGNAQKKSPGHREGGPQTEACGSQGHRRGHRANADKHKPERPAGSQLPNGAQGGVSSTEHASNANNANTTTTASGETSRLDVPCGALPPRLARIKNEGNELFKNGQFGDALKKYTQAINGCTDGIESPEDISILYSNRAACYLKDGNSSDCIQDCTKALELQPFSLKPLLRRAMAYEWLERYRMAYVDYKTVLQIDVGVQAAHDSIHRITKLLIEQDGPDWREKLPEIPLVPLSAQQHRREEPPSTELTQARAERAAQEAARRAEVRFSALKHEGNELVKKAQFQEAMEKYSECLALKPEECAIYTNRALCYLKLDCFAEAKKDCDSALQLEPTNKKAFYRRALAFKGLKDYLACSSDLQEVLQLDPNVQEAERELAEVTVLLRQSLATDSPYKARRGVPATETDASGDEDRSVSDSPSETSSKNQDSPAQITNAYEFGQALNTALSYSDVVACAQLLIQVEPDTLPQYLSNKLDGDALCLIIRALHEQLVGTQPDLVYRHLTHLHKTERFSVVMMLLGTQERQNVTHLFESLANTESEEFTASDVRKLSKKYI